MKRIYDFSRKPAKRNYTISDLQDLKITGQKLSMANPLNADEIRACRDAGIDLFVCGMDQIDYVREIAPTHFCRVGSKWAQFDSNEQLMADAFEAMRRGADMYYTLRSLDAVEKMTREGIPVQSHIGLIPTFSQYCGGLRGWGRKADEAIKNLREMLLDSKFGKSSEKVIIEEFLSGIEMSCFVLFDGKNYKVLPYAKDYKRIGENDTGLNTGGMGSVSPVPFLDNKLKQKIEDKIIKPTVEGIKNENIDYKGFIFIGLINVKNEPYVIEYNVRMGDPETQVVLSRLKNDFVDVLTCCENQTLDKIDFHFDMKTYTNVVLASGGYPEKYEKGKLITGLDNVSESTIFHAGTIKKDNNIYTNGGRVLSIVSSAPKMKEALRKSYNTISKIDFEGKTFRKDIGFDL